MPVTHLLILALILSTASMEANMMKIMVIIPLEHYNVCVAKCEPTHPEYAWLKNGIVMRAKDGGREVRIHCDDAHANWIMEFAARECPETFPYIKKLTSDRSN